MRYTIGLVLGRLVSAGWILGLLAVLPGCQTTEILGTQPPSRASLDETYFGLIRTHSAGQTDYVGFYQTFEYRATFLNSAVREATLARTAEYYKWDAAQLAREREKSLQEHATSSKFFVSFYTADRKNDTLADAKTIWRILLEVGDQRFEGTAVRSKALLPELQGLYPYHTRWNFPYIVTFPVAGTAIEDRDVRLTITGPLGARSVEFRGKGSAATSIQ